jgi:hypothetical protein
MNAPRDVSHDEAVVAMLKADPDFANEYLAAALEEAELPGGQVALTGGTTPHCGSARHERRRRPRWYTPREPLPGPKSQGKPDHQDLLGRGAWRWSAP